MQCNTYEKRIRELEHRLTEQHMQLQKYASADRRCSQNDQGEAGPGAQNTEQDPDLLETSGVTGDGTGGMQGGAGVADLMDEGVVSNNQASSSNSIDIQAEFVGDQRGSTREGGDETMSEVSGTNVPS